MHCDHPLFFQVGERCGAKESCEIRRRANGSHNSEDNRFIIPREGQVRSRCLRKWNSGFPRVQEALKIVNEVILRRGMSLPLESQRQIEEGDRFVKGGDIQFPIYGDRIKQAVSNLPEEQKGEHSQYLTELCFGDLYTRAD